MDDVGRVCLDLPCLHVHYVGYVEVARKSDEVIGTLTIYYIKRPVERWVSFCFSEQWL